MKLLLTALCASFIVAPATYAKDCDKEKCDKDKVEEGTMIAHCGKCGKGDHKEGDKDKEEKEEGTLIAGKDCGKGDCDKDKEEGTLLAGKDCGKGDCDKDKEEGTLLA